MGIRIHKALGYGLTDVRKDDPRVNRESPLLEYGALSGEAYLRWLHGKVRERRDAGEYPFSLDYAMLRDKPQLRMKDLRDACLVYQEEYGLPEVMVLRPLSCGDWARSDDDIDYMTETFLLETTADRVEVFRAGIHPYNGLYMDARDGTRLSTQAVQVVRLRSYFEKKELDAGDRRQALDEITRSVTPFADYEEASRHMAPWVPDEVRDIAEFGRLFTDPLAWTQLRPLLYTYWA